MAFRLKKFTYDLSIARTDVRIGTGIATFILVSIDDATSNVQLRLGSQSNDQIRVRTGFKFTFSPGESFGEVWLTNTAGTGNIDIYVADGLVIERDVRLTTDMIDEGFSSQEVTVAATATPIPAVPLTDRVGMIIRNVGAQTIELGSSAVTFGAGYPLEIDEQLYFTAATAAGLYGIVTAGTCALRIMEVA